jgi:hypothetical protein
MFNLLGYSACSLYVNRRFGCGSCWLLARLIFDPEDGGDASSEMSDHIQTTRRYIPEDGNNHNYQCEILVMAATARNRVLVTTTTTRNRVLVMTATKLGITQQELY